MLENVGSRKEFFHVKTKTSIGVIGCGQISAVYLASPRVFDNLAITACADIDVERAERQAQRFNIPKACRVEELLADPAIEVVINLTIPAVHAEVSTAILKAGKSVYSEKPLAIQRDGGRIVLEEATRRNLRVGCAPDTFLGGGIQTCIRLLEEGQIGTPIAATAFMLNHGMEHWHPDPYFFYQPGAGPLFDMGPYYVTALIAMLGPIRRVAGSARISFPERTVTSEARRGTRIPVNTPTHVAGILDFASGSVATMVMSFDIWGHKLPRIEVYGTEGTISVPDPNTFHGPVFLQRQSGEWQNIAVSSEYEKNVRGLGVAEMVQAMQYNRMQRANGELAYHVLDTMQSLLESSESGKHMDLASTCSKPAFLGTELASWRNN